MLLIKFSATIWSLSTTGLTSMSVNDMEVFLLSSILNKTPKIYSLPALKVFLLNSNKIALEFKKKEEKKVQTKETDCPKHVATLWSLL